MKRKHRDQETFDNFKEYWDANQDFRFFQAICNWIGCSRLMAGSADTWNWENIKVVQKGYKKSL